MHILIGFSLFQNLLANDGRVAQLCNGYALQSCVPWLRHPQPKISDTRIKQGSSGGQSSAGMADPGGGGPVPQI